MKEDRSPTPRWRCWACGGGRHVSHPELASLAIAHVDCDAFFAAIEKRDNPSLEGKPVIVGGGRRGVVSTCCYIARLSGVRSAMPMFKALALCPDAVVVKSRFDAYREASALIREEMDALTPLVQAASIDEAYLDLSGTERLHGMAPAQALSRMAQAIERRVGITVSVGLSSNKFLAKTASELNKPRGFAALGEADAPAFLAGKPPGFLHGVGPKFEQKLIRDGFATVGRLQALSARELAARYGETGLWLHERSHGRDNRPVTPGRERKSVSAETTFDRDLSGAAVLEDRLWPLCVKVADRLKAQGLEGHVVTLKLKTRRFKSLTRRASLDAPTQLARTLFSAARPLLAREAEGGAGPFRLIGVGLSGLSPAGPDRADLLDPAVGRRAAAERASDAARAKFGAGAVQTGRALRLSAVREALPDSGKRGGNGGGPGR